MKKYIKLFLLFISPLMIVFLSVEILLHHIPNNYSYKYNQLIKVIDTTEILILGSSHAYFNIDPEYMVNNSYNMAYVSQTILYDKLIFERVLSNEKHGKLTTIIIPISYFSLSRVKDSGEEAWRKYFYFHFMNITSEIIPKVSFKKISIFLSIPKKMVFDNVLNYLFNEDSNISCTKKGWGTNYSNDKRKNLHLSSYQTYEEHENKSLDFAYNLSILKSIIKLAQKNSIKVILFTSPAYHEYVELLNKKKLDKMITSCRKLDNCNENVFYFNLLNSEIFTTQDYYDADHLNHNGAKKLTRLFSAIISQ